MKDTQKMREELREALRELTEIDRQSERLRARVSQLMVSIDEPMLVVKV